MCGLLNPLFSFNLNFLRSNAVVGKEERGTSINYYSCLEAINILGNYQILGPAAVSGPREESHMVLFPEGP